MNNKFYAIAALAALPCLVQPAMAKVDLEDVSAQISILNKSCHDFEMEVIALERRNTLPKDTINEIYKIYEKANTAWHKLQRLEQLQPGVTKDVMSRRNNKQLTKNAFANAKKILQSMNYVNNNELKKGATSLENLLAKYVVYL